MSFTLRTPFTLSAPQLKESFQTANPGDIVYHGELRVAVAATLEGAYASNLDIEDTARYDVVEGTTLTAVSAPNLGTFVFCTIAGQPAEVTLTATPPARSTCFLDLNSDFLFEHVYAGWGMRDWLQFTLMSITLGQPLDTPIPYSLADTSGVEPVNVAVRYETALLEGYYFVPLAEDRFGNLRQVAGALESSRYIQHREALPQTIRVMNVEIEVLSFDDGEITYTVRRNEDFDEDAIVSVN